jgi:hypothetical protein
MQILMSAYSILHCTIGCRLSIDYKERHMDRLLTQAEVAERIRRPLKTMRYWRYVGKGPQGANIAGRILYRESDVEAWLEQQFALAEGSGSDSEAV